MRVLVVGCGYVGLALGTELVRHGHEVTGLRRNCSDISDFKAAGVRAMSADITKPASLPNLTQPFDWVVNCISAGGGLSEYQQAYLEGSRHLLSWLSVVPPAKFVYTSSTSVYGQLEGNTVDEDSITDPESETSKVLVQTERMLLQAAAEGFPAVVLRVAGIYGPGRAYWLEQLRTGKVVLDGSGERILNMIHRDDVVEAIIVALARGRAGRVYNAVDDEPVSQRVFLAGLSKLLKVPMPSCGSEHTLGLKKRGVTNKRVGNRRIKEELGFHLRFPSFREGYSSLLPRVA